MLIFLDTEYTNMIDRDLISLAMVSEDGKHEIYIEINDFPRGKCSRFVNENVLPNLDKYQAQIATYASISQKLLAWFKTLPRSVMIGCDSIYDWDILKASLSGQYPENMKGRIDLRPMIDSGCFHDAVTKYHTLSGPWHHALHDARAHRIGWLAWMDSMKSSPKELPTYYLGHH